MSDDRPRTTRLSSTTVYENPWMRLREDTVRYANGDESIYGIVEKPDYVVVIPWHESRLGVVTQYRYPIDAWRTEFPQGGIDASDPTATAADAAARELREETGLVAGTLTRLGTLHEGYGFMSQRFHVYVAAVAGVTAASPEPSEGEMTFGWLTVDDLWSAIDSGDVTDSASVAAMGLFTRWLRT